MTLFQNRHLMLAQRFDLLVQVLEFDLKVILYLVKVLNLELRTKLELELLD